MRSLVDKLSRDHDLTDAEFLDLISYLSKEDASYLYESARAVQREAYGTGVFLRGLIEFTNYCRNDCFYCGIRRSNRNAERYRLTDDQILQCCEQGYSLGFRTFVLQGGEDPCFTDERMVPVVRSIRRNYPDCAITLSLGERSRDSYQALFDAGADRYLLRHETANEEHYRYLHPPELSLKNRKDCLFSLREIGFQVGAGMMIGAPGQRKTHLVKDLRFLQDLRPHMIGIGPFIPHKDTPFHGEPSGTLEDTLHMLAILRLMFPNVLLPATTALGTIHQQGRELGILAGANVIMPNLSPVNVRGKYLLYDGKICTGDEAAECHSCLERRMEKIGYHIIVDRGDSKVT